MSEHAKALSIDPEATAHLRGDEKRAIVRNIFDRIAPTYDRMNLVISLGQTTLWRKRALANLGLQSSDRVLDVGCGTGWVVQYLAKKMPGLQIEGMDLSPGMLEEARKLDPDHSYFEGDVLAIDRPDNHYDFVCTVFTSRNFPDIEASVHEMMRVVAPGGRLLILDSFPPVQPTLWSRFQTFWMARVVPNLVRPFSDPQAYRYLAASILQHVDTGRLTEICREAGASEVSVDNYSFGSASRVLARKAQG